MTFEPVNSSNQDTSSEILSGAFHDDPVINWTCNEPKSVRPFFDFTLPVYVPHELSYMDPQGRGAASWLPPSKKMQWPITLSSIITIARYAKFKGLYRMLIAGLKTEKNHPKTPHYYLFAIGVLPQYKGQGVGSALIAHVLKRCDDEGIPAYLENSKEQNLAFYEGHGFKVMAQIRFGKSAPPLWLMWREPR